MNSTLLRVLAALMMIAAIVTAFLGYRISNKKPADTLKVVVPSFSQIVARTDIPADHMLTTDDLEVIRTQQDDKRTFSNAQNLIGKITTSPVNKGDPFKKSQFPIQNLLAEGLAPSELAIAIKVNEVIGVGGFIKPGDHVDVLLYLRADRETGDMSSAQIILSNVKVLAYGELISKEEADQEDPFIASVPNKLGKDNRRSDGKKDKDSRSAILAVPKQDVSKLMLADNTGILRLALRGESNQSAKLSFSTDNHFISLGDVSQSSVSHFSTASTTNAVALAPAKQSSIALDNRRERVIVHRGDQVEVVNVAR